MSKNVTRRIGRYSIVRHTTRDVVSVALLSGLAFIQNATASDVSDIEATYDAWVQVTNDKDIDQWSSYLAPEALFVPPSVPPLETKADILAYYRTAFADPLFALECRQLHVDVAESGETAWARGVCHATFTDSEGRMAKGASRWFKIWLKQPDGSWKCRINTWNYEAG